MLSIELKDYYAILQVPPSATVHDIKKAYRRLAMQWHPDKHGGDLHATVQFNLIKEAYETLTHPQKKEQYLQQRWYQKSTGRAFTSNEALTPAYILAQCLELNRYVSKLDKFRLDEEGLSKYILGILSDTNLQQLQLFSEMDVNCQIVLSLLDTSRHLSFTYLQPITERLIKVETTEDHSDQLQQLLRKKKWNRLWDNYKVIAALVITILICLIIFLAGR